MSGWGLGWFGGGQTKKEAPKKAILQLRAEIYNYSQFEN
jgi:charged multivesicular body protein 4